ncbi:hypothetical protein C8R47DRAFT_725308 [Mycena vitilis]|nr:hypothetical protein C8R47DRAFT_725308 [Mycena vitilis]
MFKRPCVLRAARLASLAIDWPFAQGSFSYLVSPGHRDYERCCSAAFASPNKGDTEKLRQLLSIGASGQRMFCLRAGNPRKPDGRHHAQSSTSDKRPLTSTDAPKTDDPHRTCIGPYDYDPLISRVPTSTEV